MFPYCREPRSAVLALRVRRIPGCIPALVVTEFLFGDVLRERRSAVLAGLNRQVQPPPHKHARVNLVTLGERPLHRLFVFAVRLLALPRAEVHRRAGHIINVRLVAMLAPLRLNPPFQPDEHPSPQR